MFRSDPPQRIALSTRLAFIVVLTAALGVGTICGLRGVIADLRADVFPVVGHVRVDGWPPAGAELAFHRVDAAHWVVTTPTGIVEEDGSYRLRSIGGRTGAPAGRYVVTIQWQPPRIGREGIEPGPNLLPERYAAPSTSPIHAVVGSAPTHLPPFELSCLCTEALRRQRKL